MLLMKGANLMKRDVWPPEVGGRHQNARKSQRDPRSRGPKRRHSRQVLRGTKLQHLANPKSAPSLCQHRILRRYAKEFQLQI